MFNSTEEALSFGLQASDEDRKMLIVLREMYLCDFDKAMSRQAFNQASIFATKAQFCREALHSREIYEENPELF